MITGHCNGNLEIPNLSLTRSNKNINDSSTLSNHFAWINFVNIKVFINF